MKAAPTFDGATEDCHLDGAEIIYPSVGKRRVAYFQSGGCWRGHERMEFFLLRLAFCNGNRDGRHVGWRYGPMESNDVDVPHDGAGWSREGRDHGVA